ncbi:iron uptake transporter deferrochelatase/peroxidase subunit [Gulosibacter molinativorax]|uniref:Deferrochelatase n=1 Tax=Gulosibacter molinativorax TaxID=256821 RepID=A0ABT7C8U8_9MICO|nr:iron uptake transporter deferrochelatase/peroxidase subunit [Gulosibacter molinativorax]MDJ1371189.1 deferrochelatase/peroxidase EfeB [Gulosibacter molinativorax]QUY63004.1 Putative deferrochelatase/peroxidase EfeN [Gulosibacter molinativorax]
MKGSSEPDASAEPGESERRGLSRRGLFGLLGGGAAGIAIGALGTIGVQQATSTPPTAVGESDGLTYDFGGVHQAGIITPAQDRMHFAAFDMREGLQRADLIELLQDWTYAASRLTLGAEVAPGGAFGGGAYYPPEDSGEAVGLGASGLTITFGFGKSLFITADGQDRFGLASILPDHFTELPVLVNDFIDPALSDGDLCIQACANDPQVAVHAIRNLTRIAMGRARLRWSQLGFGRTSSTSTSQATPRNLFGLKDGTNNLKAEQPGPLGEHVWISDAQGPAWAVNGTYMVVRRIAMTIEVWDGLQLAEQERVTGRDKVEGAPLSGGTEFTAPDFAAKGSNGAPLIDERSHVFRVHPDQNGGIRMLRRGYNYVDGNDAQGRLDAGLFFIAFVNAPERFAKVHKNMARDDLFVEYLKTNRTGVFFVPPGVSADEYVGQRMFEA